MPESPLAEADRSGTMPGDKAPRPSGAPLAGRLLRMIFGCYFGVALAVTAGQVFTEYRSAQQRLEADIRAMERTFGRGLADALWNFNTGVLQGIITGIAEMPVVVGVEVRDERGQLVGSADASRSVKRAVALYDRPFERSFDLVYVDENRAAHPVGRWTVRSDDGIALDQVTDTLIVILINSVLKTLALCVIFWIVIRRMVGQPLARISAFLAELDADNLGSRPLQLRPRESREFHLLAGVFNALVGKLRRAFDDNAALLRALQEANTTLQARVEDRTRDLARLAHTDPLTGLSNRRDLDACLERAVRAGADGTPFSLILVDIDHFKAINDRYGHAVGDQVLVAVAGILGCGLNDRDVLGRWGGEEFMILCHGTALEAAGALAEAIRLRVEAAALPTVGGLTCSFGVAALGAGESGDSLLGRADAALYAAKARGRNRVEAAGGQPTSTSSNAA